MPTSRETRPPGVLTIPYTAFFVVVAISPSPDSSYPETIPVPRKKCALPRETGPSALPPGGEEPSGHPSKDNYTAKKKRISIRQTVKANRWRGKKKELAKKNKLVNSIQRSLAFDMGCATTQQQDNQHHRHTAIREKG